MIERTSRLTAGSTSGFLCPRCGASAGVTDSRPAHAGAVRRRRKCSLCEHRFTTYEVMADRYGHVFGLGGMENTASNIIAELTTLRDRLESLRKTTELLDKAKGER